MYPLDKYDEYKKLSGEYTRDIILTQLITCGSQKQTIVKITRIKATFGMGFSGQKSETEAEKISMAFLIMGVDAMISCKI